MSRTHRGKQISSSQPASIQGWSSSSELFEDTMGIHNPPPLPLPQREKRTQTTPNNNNTTNNNTDLSDTINDQPSNTSNNQTVQHSHTLPDPRLTNNNPKSDTIQPVTIIPSNTVTTMDTYTGIDWSRSAYQFGMALPSITNYKNSLIMTLLGTPQGWMAISTTNNPNLDNNDHNVT